MATQKDVAAGLVPALISDHKGRSHKKRCSCRVIGVLHPPCPCLWLATQKDVAAGLVPASGCPHN
ncbi:hypothetical protein KKE26_05880 [bacterium]|nr:hypothetical protein [bacterium]